MLPSLPVQIQTEPRVIPAAPPEPAALNDLGAVLSPSQVRTFRDCGAKWYFKYALGLPDPPNGSLVRGRVVHQMAETFFRARLEGARPDPDDLQASFEEAWDAASAGAAFGADEDVDLLKRQAALLTRKYLDEVAPEIYPAAVSIVGKSTPILRPVISSTSSVSETSLAATVLILCPSRRTVMRSAICLISRMRCDT